MIRLGIDTGGTYTDAVVIDTENSLSGSLRSSAQMVPLPVPDGPDMTYNLPFLRLMNTSPLTF